MIFSHRRRTTALLSLLWSVLPSKDLVDAHGRQLAGDSVRLGNLTLSMGCPEFLSAFYEASVSKTKPYRTFTITKGPGYGYIALHFSKLLQPPGSSIILRGVENVDVPDVIYNLTEAATMRNFSDPTFDAPPILAKELQVELYRDVESTWIDDTTISDRQCYGFAIDSYTYMLVDDSRNISSSTEAQCANDNTIEAMCAYGNSSSRTAFLASRPVARLLIQKEDGKTSACTGWLLGSENHMITNYHCINSAAQAGATRVEFMAGGLTCAQNCQSWGGCPGTVEAISSKLVRANEALDYALVKLQTNVDLTAKYGFLRLKATQGFVNQEIYIPQYPLFYGKRLAMVNDYGTKTSILSTSATGCDATGYSYNGDTQPGSSGSPVLDAEDHGVVALHHCGQFCANTGIPSVSIIADLQSAGVLPQSAVDPGDKKNTVYFPTYQPPAASPPPVLYPMLTFNGAIQRDSGACTVSVDQFEFVLIKDAQVSFDVLSAEVSDDGKYTDVNGDCLANYLDATMFLFRKGDNTTVLVNDDDTAGDGKNDGSVSKRDPFAQTYLKAGTYILAIGAMPVTATAAYNGVADATSDDPEIYSCVQHSQSGAYRVQFQSSEVMTFNRLPPAVATPGACYQPASSICSF